VVVSGAKDAYMYHLIRPSGYYSRVDDTNKSDKTRFSSWRPISLVRWKETIWTIVDEGMSKVTVVELENAMLNGNKAEALFSKKH
jgi:hypothetical protein